ncbi:MAG TPA: GNAT family N-acetyltransferase [Candidatus Didemnitutus sp.]|nr:GNAT family N-acetyltransferase [Candidatus Didemnitutus sp.]HVY21487.1 GNAT family N-acetyltransferase [Bauldia sp.]
MATFAVELDGYTDLPPGKLANVVTFLEMREPPPAPPAISPDVVLKPRPDPGWYRTLYQRIGEPWLWFSRAAMSDAELMAGLWQSTTEVLALQSDGVSIGLAELDYAVPGSVEIATFGVVPEAVGTGAAHTLMTALLARVFGRGAARVWLHTCTFDHPKALAFYRRAGFQPYKFAIEVSDDPRATGKLPATAAPQIPLLLGK